MDDLNGLDWSAKANGSSYNPPPLSYTSTPSAFTALPPSRPNSGTVITKTASSSVKPATTAADSFANLLPSAANKPKTNLTLQDRQQQLLQERQRQIDEQQQRHAAEAKLWNSLGATPDIKSNGHPPAENVDDILAAFNSTAKVDRSSHFPPPSSLPQSGRSTPAISRPAPIGNGATHDDFDDDDDPFGLSSMPSQHPPTAPQTSIDDDFLGELGKPMQPKPTPVPSTFSSHPGISSELARAKSNSTPVDRSIAELVDMGFPPERARVALEETNGNLQNAVGWLLNNAHAESQQKAKARMSERTESPAESDNGRVPSWMRADSRPTSQPRRPDSSTSNSDRDPSQVAAEVGASFLKSANSLWKAGRKQMQKAVADFQQDGGDPSQPKWMRDASADSLRSATSSQPPRSAASAIQPRPHSTPTVTDEAMLLESRDSRPQRPSRSTNKVPNEPSMPSPLRGRSPAQVLPERPGPSQRFPQHPTSQARHPTKLSREQVEEKASQAYVSAARRRKPAPTKEPESDVDLFSPAPTQYPQQNPTRQTPSTSARHSPAISKPLPIRDIPSVSPGVLSQSAQHRAKGTDAFKRGDFDAAHQAYTAALLPLPSTHPVAIVVLSNRALTAIRTGDPKLAIQDADKALSIIGTGRGDNEVVDLGAEGRRDMKDLYGKSLMRKAEALEAMEKWKDALAVWRLAIESNVGGSTAVRGRDRCLKASSPAPAVMASTSKQAPLDRAPVRKSQPQRPKVASSSSGEAVRKLRAQNEAADRLDDEKFALSDAVTARIEEWRGGKKDNLRALLASMEAVLWEGAGWKKVSMAELVLPNKVKIIYMKAIARVHPDKIPQEATTEQRMISGSVFSTLNEAWDKFKADNGM